MGYRLTRWHPDEAELELVLEPRHLNRSNVPHGGVIATLIDTACGFAGCYSAEPGKRRRAVTLSLNTSFIGQASAETILTAKARRTGGGQTVFFARCDLLDGDGHLIATGEGSFKSSQRGDKGTSLILPPQETLSPAEALSEAERI